MPLTIEVARPGSPVSDAVVRAYLTEVASRWYGRPATVAEVEQALRDEPSADLRGDTGILLVALDDGRPVGCAGARFAGATAELTKVFTEPTHRGRGVATALLDAVEEVCRVRGAVEVRLDTRAELAEACALYERRGFVRVAPFTDDPHSDRWYRKGLGPAPSRPL